MWAAESAARWPKWLEETALAGWMRESVWAYPSIEAAHIIGFTVLVGGAVMFDLRLLGCARGLTVRAAAAHLLWWSRLSLLVVVPTGVMLFISEAAATWANAAFRLKLILIGAAGINALIFHRWTFKSVEGWDQPQSSLPIKAKIAAFVSLTLWAGVITCGRFIAYL